MEGITVGYCKEQYPSLSAAERVEDALELIVGAARVSVGGVSAVLTAEAARGAHQSIDRANNQANQPGAVLAGFQAVL